MIAVYIHWPFCLSKCPYCSFPSNQIENECDLERFGELLFLDLKNELEKINVSGIRSVFFGGGTPSLMNPKHVESMLWFLGKNYSLIDDIEISLEANPGTFDYQKMKDFHSVGINRLSLGIQSFSDKNLRFLGRAYNGKRALAAAEVVSGIFKNFNFDFMYGYACQSKKELELDLQKAIDFGCNHVSCYQLTIEENTPFYEDYVNGKLVTLDENVETDLYKFIGTFLERYDVHRYEVSNYAKLGYECAHNMCYWKCEDYLGVGPGAHSRITVGNRKMAMEKTSDPQLWAKFVADDISGKILSEMEELEEFLIMGLRLKNGLNLSEIRKKISKHTLDKVISSEKVNFLRQHNLIENLGAFSDHLRLSKRGALKLDAIINFLLNL